MPKAAQDSQYSFSRRYRLISKQDFQFVFTQPGKVARKNLLALYRLNQQCYARLGIIIPKHHAKRAVDRNRIRRVIRESFRQHKEALKGLDIIVLMRSEWSPLAIQSLRDDVLYLWQQTEVARK